MKKTFTNIVHLIKTNKKNSIIVAIALVAVVAVVAAVSVGERGKVPIDTQSAASSTESTTAEVVESTTEADVSESESTTESTAASTTESATESTTKKVTTTKAETSTKKPTTTKAETTTKKNTEVTFNGYKPYEVFVDEDGDEVYYNDFGRLCVAEPTTGEPNPDYDASYCHACGSEDCQRAMSTYYCVICDEEIPAHECHPEDHYDASHSW